MHEIRTLAGRSPQVTEAYDATRPEFTRYAAEVEGWFAQQHQSYDLLDAAIRSSTDGVATGIRLALKLAESRRLIAALGEPVTVTLLNPVFKETGRMQRRSEHPHGEDSLRTKVEALRELESLNPNFRARVVVIDDECPDGSGELAGRILAEYRDPERYRVLFLGEAIDRGDPNLPPGLTHKNGERRSVKGGSVLYGMRTSLGDDIEGRHILVDNDADLSVHPTQLGLLVDDIVAGAADVVAGSRREVDSVSSIGSGRDSRGRLFIEIWQHLLPQLAERIQDTNRAFKAFDAAALVQILNDIEAYTFPYQIELLQASVSRDIRLRPRGIAYLDSEAASTQQGDAITETYLHQIHQIIDIARRYDTIDPDDQLLRFFSGMTEPEWAAIESDPPEELTTLIG